MEAPQRSISGAIEAPWRRGRRAWRCLEGAFEALEKALVTVEASKLNEAKKEEFVKVASQYLAAIKHNRWLI